MEFNLGNMKIIRQILYADDITLFVEDRYSVNRLQYIFDEFGEISGLRVNKGKTNFLIYLSLGTYIVSKIFGGFISL